jgi:hypothetical protein
MRKQSKKERERAKELISAEADYEAEMNERIVTESALIRAEWCEALRAQRLVTKQRPMQLKERHVPEQWGKGVEFQ